MAKPRRAPKTPSKTNSQRLVETLLIFAPAPIRAIASTQLGSRIILTAGAGLLASGAMSVDWEKGIPHVNFHKDKMAEAAQQVKEDLSSQGIQWTANSQGVVFSGDGQQVPVPVQSLPGFQAAYQGDPNLHQPFYPPQPPAQNYPPGYYPPPIQPPQNAPYQNGIYQNGPLQNGPYQNGTVVPPGYGYGQAQGPTAPPGYYR